MITYVEWISDNFGFTAIRCKSGSIIGDKRALTCQATDRRSESCVVHHEQTDNHGSGEHQNFVGDHFRIELGALFWMIGR